ncbi:hypothetical protein D770_25050 [Flammeovirgaceae bacterium 311]|nr:hypothetical protein D770_25050 [Flammeovirgaceae bacterium 311]
MAKVSGLQKKTTPEIMLRPFTISLRTIIFSAVLLMNVQCMQKPETSILSVQNTLILSDIPSGSGLAVVEDSIYLVGDDSPFLFQLDRQHVVRGRHLLLQQWADSVRIAKSSKPDFESITLADWEKEPSLLVFGSGSKSPERDSLLVLPLKAFHNPKRYSLTALYDAICQKEGIGRESFNIEGAVVAGNDLWLFNRGTNSIIVAELASLIQAVKRPAVVNSLKMEVHPHQLPQIAGKQARFSGACHLPGTDLIFFTASVEDTENWIDDGEILGSLIGVLDMNAPAQANSAHWWLTDKNGNYLPEKLESIDVLESREEGLILLAVSDNDLGNSVLFELRLDTSLHTKP